MFSLLKLLLLTISLCVYLDLSLSINFVPVPSSCVFSRADGPDMLYRWQGKKCRKPCVSLQAQAGVSLTFRPPRQGAYPLIAWPSSSKAVDEAGWVNSISSQPEVQTWRGKFRSVLQLRLQQRRTREQLADQGIMPHPASDGSSLEAQLRLKRARLAEDLNEKLALRPGPLELVQKNIIPLDAADMTTGISREAAAVWCNTPLTPAASQPARLHDGSCAFEEDSSIESLSPGAQCESQEGSACPSSEAVGSGALLLVLACSPSPRQARWQHTPPQALSQAPAETAAFSYQPHPHLDPRCPGLLIPRFHRHYEHLYPTQPPYDHSANHITESHLETLLGSPVGRGGDVALLKMAPEDGGLEDEGNRDGEGYGSPHTHHRHPHHPPQDKPLTGRDQMDTPLSPLSTKVSTFPEVQGMVSMTFSETPWETMEWLDLMPPSSATAFSVAPPSGPSIFNTEFLDVTDINLNSAMDLHLEHW
ncbi:myocardin isoform X1 [Lates japonicus]|uniref:Phosphatase and actin regulator n=1 Tax=Lates japonicus TaxID=270547 RepID=A0AAD3MPZ6_LATJO|nr:myocardin isoform X1 [Lates japonicus]